MELCDLEAGDESADFVSSGFFHLYVVRGGSATKQQFVRSRKGAISRVSPDVVEERLIAHLDASETNFIGGLGRERPGIPEDCRQ